MKKNILIKSIILTLLLSLFVSIFCLVSFADSSNGVFTYGDSIVFKEELSSSFIPSGINNLSFHVYDDSNNRLDFYSISFQYRGYIVVLYVDSDGNSVEVYNQDGWISEFYRTIHIDDSIVLDGDFKGFIDINTDSSVPIYDTLFKLISDTFFGSRELDPIEKLSITLLCLVLCVAILCIPIVICYLILIGLSRIGVRYL